MQAMIRNNPELSSQVQIMNSALVEILKLEKTNSPIPEALTNSIREVGGVINRIGGIDAMRLALQQHVKPYDQRLVEMYWDGIGA